MNKKLAAALMAAAIGGSTAACGHGGTGATAASSPPSCHQQYETWKHGPAHASVDRMLAAMQRVEAGGGSQDLLKVESSLKTAGADAQALQGMPLPRCADPHGYWHLMLARITAGADNVKAQGGVGGLLLAKGTLSDVPGLLSKLHGELLRALGTNY